jgi:oligopeptidase B
MLGADMRKRQALLSGLLFALGALSGAHGDAKGARIAPASAAAAAAPAPPVADVRPFTVESPNGNRVDNYYWLRDDTRTNADVLAYLAAENLYTNAMLAHVKPLAETLYREFVDRTRQDDSSVPYRERGWWYYTRYDTGQEHPIYARRKGSLKAPEQVMLDGPQLANGHDYYQVGQRAVSPDNQLLAYVEDTVGRYQYTLRFRSLATGQTLPDKVENVESSLAWAADSRTVLYVEKDPVTLLGLRVRRHVVGTDPKADPVVYEQDDPSFYTTVDKTRDERYVVIHASSTVSSEMRYADATDPKLAFRVFLPRERDHEYQAEHLDGRWIIRTNWRAKNFRLMAVRNGEESDRSKWRELLAHRDDALVNDFEAFHGFLAVDERAGGLRRIRIHRWSAAEDSFIASDDPTYAFALADNHEVDTELLRYTYDSLTTPTSTYDYNVRTGERTLLKRDPVLGGFSPASYSSEFVWATARDGTKIPVSLVYRKGVRRDGTAPLLQYGYGSYGLSNDPHFSIPRLSLLDRGFVYAIAHVRGGQEMGRAWYDDGKLLNKQNTFNDFVDTTRFLVKEGYADRSRVFALGRSAGGLLMGAIANQAPQDYRAIVAAVPFVDVVTTMLDESIPLTTNEFDEWGNPRGKRSYDYILGYSPYDNVCRQAYPAMLATTSLFDSQVQYYEPAKWVARLRAMKTDTNPLLLRIAMEAGHGGKSGRFERYRQTAEEFGFVVDLAGVRQ